jgi:hypothetical protein
MLSHKIKEYERRAAKQGITVGMIGRMNERLDVRTRGRKGVIISLGFA